MSWIAPIDACCERGSPDYWAEPVNALTNAAFVIAAAVMAARLPLARALVAVLAVIGLGSFLFHTHANRLTAVPDVAPSLAFILLFVFAATRDLPGARPWVAGLATLGFLRTPADRFGFCLSSRYRDPYPPGPADMARDSSASARPCFTPQACLRHDGAATGR